MAASTKRKAKDRIKVRHLVSFVADVTEHVRAWSDALVSFLIVSSSLSGGLSLQFGEEVKGGGRGVRFLLWVVGYCVGGNRYTISSRSPHPAWRRLARSFWSATKALARFVTLQFSRCMQKGEGVREST